MTWYQYRIKFELTENLSAKIFFLLKEYFKKLDSYVLNICIVEYYSFAKK